MRNHAIRRSTAPALAVLLALIFLFLAAAPLAACEFTYTITGPGLSAEDAARLFERGYRGSSAGGTSGGGIGLSIVSRLCDLYGWDVGVAPRPEGGAVATLVYGQSEG